MYKLEELEVYRAAKSLRTDISLVTKDFPSTEKFNLIAQISRSSRSISANIAEGYGRFHYQENIQFCRQARGSLFETYDHLTVAVEEGYIDNDKFEQLRSKQESVLKLLNGYIAYLKSRKTESQT